MYNTIIYIYFFSLLFMFHYLLFIFNFESNLIICENKSYFHNIKLLEK